MDQAPENGLSNLAAGLFAIAGILEFDAFESAAQSDSPIASPSIRSDSSRVTFGQDCASPYSTCRLFPCEASPAWIRPPPRHLAIEPTPG